MSLQSARFSLQCRRYKQVERSRKRAKYVGNSVQWTQWMCREAVLLEYMGKLVPPEIVQLIEARLPSRPSVTGQ